MNKVYYGLKNLHYGEITLSGSTYTYGTPKPWIGAVNFAATPNGEVSEFEADDITFFRTSGDSGYDISLEVSQIPEDFLTAHGGYVEDTNHVAFDKEDEFKPFYLLGEISGDANKTLFAFYNCALAQKLNLEAETSKAKTPKTRTISIKAMSSADQTVGKVAMGRTKSDTTATVSTGWFTAIYKPAFS